MDKLGLFFKSLSVREERHEVQKLLSEVSIDGLVKYMRSELCRRVIVMVGAGMSTSAGIPDFRSPGSGIYANLKQYNLPFPEAMFEIGYFRQRPEPFFHLARELLPTEVKPTRSHFFLKLLSQKGKLRRVYTQNIDCLERVAGIPDEEIVEAHGSFYRSHCLSSACRKEYSLDWIKSKIMAGDESAPKVPKCDECGSTVKPDIVFFGERLPDRFFRLTEQDFPDCDLLIVIGTSLCVQPFASLLELVPQHVPRLAINLTPFKQPSKLEALLGMPGSGFDFESESNFRDIFMQGRCDDMCDDLAARLGWKEELDQLMKDHK